jgi:hypothetical protein
MAPSDAIHVILEVDSEALAGSPQMSASFLKQPDEKLIESFLEQLRPSATVAAGSFPKGVPVQFEVRQLDRAPSGRAPLRAIVRVPDAHRQSLLSAFGAASAERDLESALAGARSASQALTIFSPPAGRAGTFEVVFE